MRSTRAALIAVAVTVLLAFVGTVAQAQCNASTVYSLAKLRWTQSAPVSREEFDGFMAGLGMERDDSVWKCEDEQGTLLAQLMPKFVMLDYTRHAGERMSETVLATLRTMGKATLAGPSAITYELTPDAPKSVKGGRVITVKESITVSLAGEHEETQCTIWFASGGAR